MISENLNFIFSHSNLVKSYIDLTSLKKMIWCESVKQTSQIFDLMMVAYSVSTQRTNVSRVSFKKQLTINNVCTKLTEKVRRPKCEILILTFPYGVWKIY